MPENYNVPEYEQLQNRMLQEIIVRLERIEQRQIRTTKLVEEVEKAEESHVVGSFGSVDRGETNEKE